MGTKAPVIDAINVRFGSNVMLLREYAKLNQAEIAKQMKISQATYSRLEAGTHDVTLTDVILLSRFFDVHPKTLLKGIF